MLTPGTLHPEHIIRTIRMPGKERDPPSKAALDKLQVKGSNFWK